MTQQGSLPLGIEASSTSYGYNTNRNRLVSAGAVSFGYDDEGQLTSGYGTSYTFDDAHRLTAIGSSYGFTYNGVGDRIRVVRNGVETRYIYDASGNLIAEADANNVIQKYYIYGAGLLAMVTASNDLYCYHFDATGNTVALTNGAGAVVNKYAYTPFGTLSGNSIENIYQPFKFVGQYGVMAEPNGLYYMRARYYDPNVGRFISEDPIGFDGGDVNLFAYVGNNPIIGIDPTGLSDLVFNRANGTLTVYDSQSNQVGQFPAANNTTRSSNGPWPNGMYDFSHYNSHPESGPTGPYGSNGIFVFDVPGRYGMGVHSGRRGPESPTLGCIRTTDEATGFLKNLNSTDPLQTIKVKDY